MVLIESTVFLCLSAKTAFEDLIGRVFEVLSGGVGQGVSTTDR